jgi:AcrR family transcriptional regulator
LYKAFLLKKQRNYGNKGNYLSKKRFHCIFSIYIRAVEKIDDKFQQILMGALDVFMKYGIRSVTMDDLARHLGVSKKTIYKYVSDKKELVHKGMEYHHQLEVCAIDRCVQQKLNAIDENFEISKVIVDQLKNVHPSVMYDLQKYYPDAMSSFQKYKMTVVKDWVSSNMQRGIEQGLYRNDLNIPILTSVYIARMDDFFNRDLFPEEIPSSEIYMEVFRYHIRGLASEKGITYLKEKVKNTQTR